MWVLVYSFVDILKNCHYLNTNPLFNEGITMKDWLKTMINSTFVPKHHVKTFLTAKTAAMLALVLASTVLAQSYSGGTEGIDAPREEELVEAAEDEDPLIQITIERMLRFPHWSNINTIMVFILRLKSG
jgi:hypothetical protein